MPGPAPPHALLDQPLLQSKSFQPSHSQERFRCNFVPRSMRPMAVRPADSLTVSTPPARPCKRRRSPLLEMLETRTLLSITPSWNGGDVTFTGDGTGGDHLTLSETTVSGHTDLQFDNGSGHQTIIDSTELNFANINLHFPRSRVARQASRASLGPSK